LKDTVKTPAWTDGEGSRGDIVLTSRCRLARNFKEIPFPHRAGEKERASVAVMVRDLLQDNPVFSGHLWIDLKDLSPLERALLLEEHVISPAFSTEAAGGRALTHNPRKTESMMVNEEDHLRIQVIEPGLELKKCWHRVNRLDDEIESVMDYAFSSETGFKTACPSNMGTGLRASVMLHLPALFAMGSYKGMSQYYTSLGMTVRGVMGEGTAVTGNLVQISNPQMEMQPEEETISRLEKTALHIVEQEKSAREKLFFESREASLDKVHRDLALLQSARVLPFEEFMSRISSVRMGVEEGVLPPIPRSLMGRLLLMARPACLQVIFKKAGEGEALDVLRASLVREQLTGY